MKIFRSEHPDQAEVCWSFGESYDVSVETILHILIFQINVTLTASEKVFPRVFDSNGAADLLHREEPSQIWLFQPDNCFLETAFISILIRDAAWVRARRSAVVRP